MIHDYPVSPQLTLCELIANCIDLSNRKCFGRYPTPCRHLQIPEASIRSRPSPTNITRMPDRMLSPNDDCTRLLWHLSYIS